MSCVANRLDHSTLGGHARSASSAHTRPKTMSLDEKGPFEWRTSLNTAGAIERLRSRVTPPRAGSSAIGDLTTSLGVVGVFRASRFDLRLQRFMASAGAMHAFGQVEDDPAGSRIKVRFGRATWVTWLRRGFIVFMLLLAGLGLLVAVRQPVFLVGTGFITVMAVLVLWSMRIRSEDRALLRSFLEETFADHAEQ